MERAKIYSKLWGSEEWLANTEKYCGKILTLNPGYMCSYHHHEKKDETFYVLKGTVYLNIGGREMVLNRGESQRVLPGENHTFASLEGISKIIEISTHHEEGDSYRLNESRSVNLNELRKKLGLPKLKK